MRKKIDFANLIIKEIFEKLFSIFNESYLFFQNNIKKKDKNFYDANSCFFKFF